MKKEYISPSASIQLLQTDTLLNAYSITNISGTSHDLIWSDKAADNTGSDSRYRNSLWDDDEDDLEF